MWTEREEKGRRERGQKGRGREKREEGRKTQYRYRDTPEAIGGEETEEDRQKPRENNGQRKKRFRGF